MWIVPPDPPSRMSTPSNAARPSAADHHTQVVEWNRTRTDYPRHACFHQLFEAQARRTPAATAVEFEGRSLTYAELDARADRWARVLRGAGIGPDVLAGICVAPSLEMLVGLLAILKAGGAYVPLDPAYPSDRLKFMMDDAAMPVVLTQRRLLATLPAGPARAFCLDEEPPADAAPDPGPARAASPDHLAYIIYTSGSTGRPKGAMITHRGLVNYLTWAVDAYRVAEGAGAPVHSSLSFDLTITGLFAPLLAGRCVFIVSAERGLEALSHALRARKNFSLVKITPAHLKLLSQQLPPAEAEGCAQSFIVGGEALLGESIRFWQENSPDTVIVNEYGPTETVVGCCVYSVERGERFSGAIPIGRPIANTQLYVLDDAMRPVPIGEKGELYIGGDGVARGYLNRPDLNARCFVANPFVADDPDAGPRLYRTGDLVRYRPDGNLEFLGRIDHQVKVRGYRIEPGEIEAVLAACPGVQAVAVLAPDDRFGERQLAAYVATGKAGVTVAALREFLRTRVPDYMVPAAFSVLPALPLTPNGKVDRAALPALAADAPAVADAPVAPGNETEARLARLWEQILELPRVGATDNFFDLGGHSLVAVRLLAEINRAFDAQIDVLTFFQQPTVRDLAAVLRAPAGTPPGPKLVTVRAGRGGVPIVFLNTGLEMFSLADQLEDHEPFFVSDVPWDAELLARSARLELGKLPSLGQLAAPHAALIAGGNLGKKIMLAGYSYGGPLALEVAHRLQRAGISVEAVFLFDSDITLPKWRRLKYWTLRQASRVYRKGLGQQWRSAKGRLRQERRRHLSLAEARRNAPESVHLVGGDVPWEVYDRIWTVALRRYRPRPIAARGFLLRAAQATYGEKRDYDGRLGWSRLFRGGLTVHEVPGDHWTMWREPHVATLGATMHGVVASLRRAAQSALCGAALLLLPFARILGEPVLDLLL